MSRRGSLMIRRSYYQVAMVTLFTALLWVSVSVYVALTSVTDVGVETTLLTPVSPIIDEATVASLSARTQISLTAEELVKDLAPASPSAAVQSSAPSPSPSPVVAASESAEVSESSTE
jgi:hypothetical protein